MTVIEHTAPAVEAMSDQALMNRIEELENNIRTEHERVAYWGKNYTAGRNLVQFQERVLVTYMAELERRTK